MANSPPSDFTLSSLSSQAPQLRLLTVVIPARNEEGCVASTVQQLYAELRQHRVPHEIIVVNDGSTDRTWTMLQDCMEQVPTLRVLQNTGRNGFGRAIVFGLDHMNGDAAVIAMADASDDPADVVRYWMLLNQGWDSVFGSRFIPGGRAIDYPRLKLRINRLANRFIQLLFRIRLNDTTNAFKAYRRTVIDGVRPLISPHFNLTVELPLKTILRGYTWTVTPVTWRNREAGVSKLRIREMGSRYLFICLYMLREKFFKTGDHRRRNSTR